MPVYAIRHPCLHCRREGEDWKAADNQLHVLPLLLPAAVVGAVAKDKVGAIGATLADVVLAAATVFIDAITSVVVRCCCSLQALQLVLLPLSLVHVLACCSFPRPEESPVVWCLQRFGMCTSCIVSGESTHMCMHVCVRSHTITHLSFSRVAGRPNGE